MLSHKAANDIECACGSKRRDETARFVGVILGVGRRNQSRSQQDDWQDIAVHGVSLCY